MTVIRAATETVLLKPEVGHPTDSRTGHPVKEVFTPLRTTILLLDDGTTRLCFVTAECYVDFYGFTNLVRARLGAILDIPGEQLAVFSSHNHSCVVMSTTYPFADVFPNESETLREDQLTPFGLATFRALEAAAIRLPSKLVPVTVQWAVGRERRISYNRKGHRADGSTYLMREEDRELLGADFNGDIDDDAPVVGFIDTAGKPVAFLVQFTAHPCTAYHPEHPVVHGDFPHIACADLSDAFGGVPVAFVQGCAGETNSKFFLTPVSPEQKVANAERFGHMLGETYIGAARQLRPSKRLDLAFGWQRVGLPFAKLPSPAYLRRVKREMDVFLERCAAGDEERTRGCWGLNFARTISPQYRSALVTPLQKWVTHALALHAQGKAKEVPKQVELVIGAFRIGDVGIVGLPCEPFLGIGRQIRRGSRLPLTIPVGYMNDNVAYVTDGPNTGDLDYSSSYFRYTTDYLPYRKPCGDLLARAGVKMLNQMSRTRTT